MMKYLLFILLFLCSESNSYSQISDHSLLSKTNAVNISNEIENSNSLSNLYSFSNYKDSSKNKAYYLAKREKFNKTGWTLLTSGLTISVINQLFIPTKTIGQGGGFSFEKTLFTVLGLGAIVTSIPYFISAHNNKSRATNFGLKNEEVNLPNINNKIHQDHYVALSFKIKI
jgi:hypothetical protein